MEPIGRQSLHFFFLIQGTEGAFANVPGPWSGPQASPALQRDTSKMVRGPAQQPLQDFTLRTPLTRGATALPLGFFRLLYVFILVIITFVGWRDGGLLFFVFN